ncbi:MAG: FAD-dependent oxidoreductase [Anaerolineae bacterium]|nr:FAD-dependent oxidoreductase [Anaerolineae bacterium]
MSDRTFILGAGITGLAAGLVSGLPVYEAAPIPGGICSSYYVRPNSQERLPAAPADGDAYHFELGGGHWIFGGDPAVLRFIRALTPVKTYQRRSSVFFSRQNLYVPYPLQNHLGYLGPETAAKALNEMVATPKSNLKTMADSFHRNFGPTLTDLFFGPFHDLYTAGLWTRIAPQDGYKSPVNISLALQGAFGQTPPVGYNVTFIYPEQGLNTLAQLMAGQCSVHYSRQVVQIDVRRHEVHFADGSDQPYDSLISTLPLNAMMEMTGLELGEPPDPYTSVLVLNIGARRGVCCPEDHWLYNPDTEAGFHRVGFYSNVDVSFLPKSARTTNERVSIYVERAYPGGTQPSVQEVKTYADAVVKELQSWEFIGEAEVVDPTWINVAYTWSWPGSSWRAKALKCLEAHNIFPVGRYGRWVFQGIADSIRDGFVVGGALKTDSAARRR